MAPGEQARLTGFVPLDPEAATTASTPSEVRVALVGCTGLLGDIIGKAVEDAPDIRIVAELDAGADLDGADLQPPNADLLLVNNVDEAKVAGWMTRAASRTPRVLATLWDGRAVSLWEVVPRRIDLGELTPSGIIETIRDSVTRQRGA